MKNKKIIYAIIGIVILISIVVIIAIISNKPMPIDRTPKEATSILEELKKKYPDKKYLKLTGGEILNEDTCFNKYSFINNNSIYIFNPEKLDIGEFTYKKVYDVDKNIKVMNITPDAGPDIKFYDYNDTIYTLHDNNTDNKINDSYDMYLKANYSLSDYLKWEYSTEFLGKKIDYDFMYNYGNVKEIIEINSKPNSNKNISKTYSFILNNKEYKITFTMIKISNNANKPYINYLKFD